MTDEEAVSCPRPAADAGEAQKVEGLGFAHALLGSAFGSVASKIQKPHLLRVKLERKRRQPRIEFIPEAGGVTLILESDHDVVCERPGRPRCNHLDGLRSHARIWAQKADPRPWEDA